MEKSQEYHEFRSFLNAHRYHPQGRYVRVGGLEDHDFDALLRGKLLRIWQWTWLHVKNAEEMELIQRNVVLARKNLESCKKERQEAKKKRDELHMKKKYLIEALSQARTKEKQLLSNLNHLEKEEENILKTRQEMNQKELLRFLYNQQNQQKSIERMKKIDQIRQIIFMEKDNNQEQDKNPPLHTTSTTTTINPILELTKKYQDLLESSQSFNEDLFDIKKIQYKENDIQCLRQMGGKKIVEYLFEAIPKNVSSSLNKQKEKENMLKEEEDEEEEEEEESTSHGVSSSYDALCQVQQLLQQNQKKHIERFLQTQQLYTKVQTKKFQLEQKLAWQKQEQTHLHRTTTMSTTCIDKVVSLEIKLIAYENAFQFLSFAYEKMVQQVEAKKHEKKELIRKLKLMATLDQRQEEIFAMIKTLKHENQVLLRNIDRIQDEIYFFVSNELKNKFLGKIHTKIDTWRKKTIEELKFFFEFPLEKLIVAKQTTNTTNIAYSDFYLYQIMDNNDQYEVNRDQTQEEMKNGIQKIFQAFGVPKYGNWQMFIETLKLFNKEEKKEKNLKEFDEKLQLETEKEQQLTISIQKSIEKTKAKMLQEEQELLPILEEILKVAKETKTQIIPALNQGIEDWYTQPAFSISSSLEETQEEMHVD